MKFDLSDWIIFGVVAIVLAVVSASIVFAIWMGIQRPTFELQKDDWVCVKAESQTYFQPMSVGSVNILVPMAMNTCIEYKQKP